MLAATQLVVQAASGYKLYVSDVYFVLLISTLGLVLVQDLNNPDCCVNNCKYLVDRFRFYDTLALSDIVLCLQRSWGRFCCVTWL